MHKLMLSLGLIVALVPAAASAQQRVNCQELAAACQKKEQLGEQGEGNCRKFRQYCQGQGRQVQPQRQQDLRTYCRDMREACLHKEQLGEQGEGNCRQYRQTCRGR